MHASVAAAWPAFAAFYEGRCVWLYQDTKHLPTTGLGHRVFTVADMVALPWLTKDGKPATEAQKRAEWTAIGKRTDLAPLGGRRYKDVATLHLTDATVDGLLTSDTPAYWNPLVKALPNLESWPADAQLALLDQAYNMGPNFVGPGWPNFTAAAKRGDFTGCAVFCLSKNKSPRDYRHQRLYTNASTVVMLGGDPETLWDNRMPSLPVTPNPTPDPPTPEPLMHSSKWGTDYLSWRGGYFPPITVAKLKAIPSTVTIVQGGLSVPKSGVSAYTHAGLGVGDASVRGMNKAEVWKMCTEMWEVNIIPCPRGFTSDSFQGKTISNINDGNEHVHFLDLDCVDSMHPQAQAQVKEILNGGDGLLGNAHYTGPSKSHRGKWSDSPWNPVNIAAEQKKKELELPTTAEVVKALTADKTFMAAVADAVLNSDSIPNTFTSNAANTNVTTRSALSLTGTRLAEVKDKIDALAAAVAAAFPEPTPNPTPPAA